MVMTVGISLGFSGSTLSGDAQAGSTENRIRACKASEISIYASAIRFGLVG